MPYSYVTFTGDGSDTTFSFAGISQMFPNTFLSFQSQLDVYVDGILKTPSTDWSVTDTTNKIITFTTAPANGTTIKIARDTKKDALLHSFSSGSIITANDLNNNTKQIFYNVQELVDSQDNSVGLVPAGDKWDFEGKPTYNGAPAEESSGFTTLSQVLALLDGATVGTFDEVDSFKFAGDGTAVNFDLTGITKTGLTADAVLVQVNGIMQDPDVFSPSHTPKGAIGGTQNVRWKKLTLNYTDFQTGSPYSPTVVGVNSKVRIHTLDAGEYISRHARDVATSFTGGSATFQLFLKAEGGAFQAAGYPYSLSSADSDPQMLFTEASTTGAHIGPNIITGDGWIELDANFGTNVSSLAAGVLNVWLEILAPDTNLVTSVSGSGGGINSNKYTLSYVGGTPRITFNTAPANGDVIVVRVLSGTFQGYIGDGSVGTDQLADDSVTAAKINVGAGSANRVLVFDASGDGTAQVPTASLVSDFNTAVRTNRLDQMAVPTGSVSLNNQKITSLAVGTDSADAVTKGQLDAAVLASGMTAAYSSGHSVPTAGTDYNIAYPSGFSTYPKAVAVRLSSSATPTYGSTSGYSTDTLTFYTDAGGSQAKATSDINHNTGAHTSMWVQVTGTTTGITIKHNSPNMDYCDIIWFK
jgi:hypothetical protein